MTSSCLQVSALLAVSFAMLPHCSSDEGDSNDVHADASGINADANGSGGGDPTIGDATTEPTPGDDARGGGGATSSNVGAQCSSDGECSPDPGGILQTCLTEFLGGYCGLRDCQTTADCPSGSACVAHDNGQNYCFLVCVSKPDCNRYRSIAVEANCSANVTFVDEQVAGSVCVPPA